MNYHSLTIEETLKQLHTDPKTGLSEKEVRIRRQANGLNILAAKKKKSLISRFFAQFSDFMILVFCGSFDYFSYYFIKCHFGINSRREGRKSSRGTKTNVCSQCTCT